MNYIQCMAKEILYSSSSAGVVGSWPSLVFNVPGDVNASCLTDSSVRSKQSSAESVPSPGSCGVDFHDVVVGGGQHQDLPRVAVVEHLSGAEGFQSRHGHALLLLVPAAHRVDAAPAADARRVCLVIEGLVQQGQVVVFHAAVCKSARNNLLRINGI